MGAMKFRTAEMTEGPEAFERFRAAMKKIVSVPKSAVVAPPKRHRPKRPEGGKANG
jgi:hypothetical protein